MRYLLCLVAIAMSEAARIPRGVDHNPHFPSFHSVYHGHGATSYQNVQIQSHGHIAVPANYEVGHASELELIVHPGHEEIPVIPIVEETHNEPSHVAVSTIAPYEEENAVQHVELETAHVIPRYYEQYDHDVHYDHQQDGYEQQQDYELTHDYH